MARPKRHHHRQAGNEKFFDNHPTIERLANKGLDKSEIVARLTGSKDNAGAAKQLTAYQLRAIGFGDSFINQVKGGTPWDHNSGGGHKNRHGGGGGQKDQFDPQQAYQDFLQQQADASREKYNQNAIDSLTNLFDSYGLSSLAPKIAQWIRDGMSEAAIVAQLRETPEYKQRFPGMKALRDQGYNAISEAEYLQLEDSYHQALQSAGLPKGFYDNPQDFVKFISNGVDPAELKQRADTAVGLANQVDPTQRQMLANLYGIDQGQLAAYFLDPKKAMPLLEKQVETMKVATAAKQVGINTDFTDASHFEKLVDNGVSADQARAGYAQIGQELDPLHRLGEIWGTDYNLSDAEAGTFFGNAEAERKRKRLVSQERAAFSGASGFDPRVSGRGSTAGQF